VLVLLNRVLVLLNRAGAFKPFHFSGGCQSSVVQNIKIALLTSESYQQSTEKTKKYFY
jgi:hypothetical protein